MAETLEHMADADLIAAVRRGDVAAFGILYERHLTSAKRAAACLVRTHTEREDLVAEAFTRVLRILREGGGPNEEFRPYLLVTLRNTAIHSATRGTPVSLYADLPDTYLAEERGDPVIDRWDANVAASAFASLPERWRTVLWHTEVEKEPPAVVATLLGMRPNSVAALAYRAREGLRQAYLRLHVAQPLRPECAQTVKKLAGYVRRNVPVPLSHKISRHLAGCTECRARAEVLTRINAEIAGLLAPIVLGAPLAAVYLEVPATAVATALAATATDSCLATGVLAVKATLFKAGAAALVAATAVTTTAAAPAGSTPVGPAPITVVDGERTASVTVPGPPLGTVLPPTPEPAKRRTEDKPERAGTSSERQATPGPSVRPAEERPEARGPWPDLPWIPVSPGPRGNPGTAWGGGMPPRDGHGKTGRSGETGGTGKFGQKPDRSWGDKPGRR